MTATSTDYVGNLILKDGHPEMLRLDDGYVSFDSDTISGIHYYIQDYMGNNRMVVNGRTDSIEQVTHYYPYGGVIGDISTNESLQKFKFEGKELDRTFGLDNYDIHARQYFAMAPMWDRPDPLSDDFPGISPYAYCGGDPVNMQDINGMNPVYDKNGNYIGCTKEGFTDIVLVSTDENLDPTQVAKMTAEELLSNQKIFVQEETGLTVEGLEKVWNHILEQFNGLEISDGIQFSTEKMGKVKYSLEHTKNSKGGGDYSGWKTYLDTGHIYGSGGYEYETTVENIASAIIFHEYYGHAVMKWGDSDNTHYKCYEAIKNSSLYNKTTERFKSKTMNELNKIK